MVVFEPQNICPVPVSRKADAAFSSPDAPAWCLQLLSAPNLCPIAAQSRQPKASTEDSFFAETLATDTTITAWQSFYRTLESPQIDSMRSANEDNSSVPIAGELVTLLALGRGMNGHSDVAHGGLVSAILDETMGMVVTFHRSPGMSGYTAFLNVTFKKPVPTPSVVLCRTWLQRKSEGRKLWLWGTVEDGQGGLFAEAESLVVETKRKMQKL